MDLQTDERITVWENYAMDKIMLNSCKMSLNSLNFIAALKNRISRNCKAVLFCGIVAVATRAKMLKQRFLKVYFST